MVRCKYNVKYRGEFGITDRTFERIGTIIGESKDKTCWRIHWDGTKEGSNTSAHKSYIEILSS